MRVQKKAGLVLEAVKLRGHGVVNTERGDIINYQKGDYLLTSETDQWPVSAEYFQQNYEVVSI